MAEHVLASTMIAPKTFEVREYPMPDIPPDAGLLRVEATGVCGSDVHQQTRMQGTAHILGHEIVGRIARLGSQAASTCLCSPGARSKAVCIKLSPQRV